MKRNTVISICKALAIILMVIGHAECPDRLHAFLYEFHMPVFFITAGYFFSLRYLDDEITFIKKRIKGLYWPFLKWSVFFLILHNWMFKLGILNEKYGNEMGGVTHPYTWHQMQQNLWNIVTAMGGYDPFLCGAFWFFRGLFVASILYLVVFKLLDFLYRRFLASRVSFTDETDRLHRYYIPVAICVILMLLCMWKTYEGLKVINLVQGGLRDMTGAFFFGCGFLFRQLERRYRPMVWTTLLFAAIVYLFSVHLTANMNWRSTFTQCISLPLPAILGFLMTYNISTYIDKRDGWLRRFLIYCGDHTLSIFVFHIISFKVVSLIKIWYYHLDYLQIGCHMAIHDHAREDCFWILYTIAGVGIPLGCTWCWQRLRGRVKGNRS